MTRSSQTIANAPWMRLVALVLAILLGVRGLVRLEGQSRTVTASRRPARASELPALGTPASVDDCIAKRSGSDQRAARPGSDGRRRREAVAAACPVGLHAAKLRLEPSRR